MINIAIVDDDPSVLSTLSSYVESYSSSKGVQCNVSLFHDGLAFIGGYKPVYDLLLLDVDMPKLDGLKTSKIVYDMDKRASIVFITNFAQYAIKGYEVDALYFMVKPVSYDNFCVMMDKARRKIDSLKEEKEIVLKEEGEIVKLRPSEVLYVDAYKHYLIYHTEQGEFRERGTIASLAKELESEGFSRAHSGILVNLRFIRNIKGDQIILTNGDALYIARGRKKAFKEDLLKYLGRSA